MGASNNMNDKETATICSEVLAPPGPLTPTSRQQVKCLAQGHNGLIFNVYQFWTVQN